MRILLAIIIPCILIMSIANSQETTSQNNDAEKSTLREKAKALKVAVQNDKSKWESIPTCKEEHRKNYINNNIYPMIYKELFKIILDSGENIRKLLSISETTDLAEFFSTPANRFERDIINEFERSINRSVHKKSDEALLLYKLYLPSGYLPVDNKKQLDFSGKQVGWIERKELCDAMCRMKTEILSDEIENDFNEKLPSLLGFNNKDEFDDWKAKAGGRSLELGYCYMNGKGVKKNMTSGFQCFEAALDFGNEEAIANIGLCYHWGTGVAHDSKKAIDYLTQASEKGFCKAKYYLAFYYFNGWDNTPKQTIMAIQLWKDAASKGDAYSLCQLGLLYYKGDSISKDYNKAFQYLSKAAEKNVPMAYYQIGICYSSGHGISKDEQIAFQYFNKAANMNLPIAQYRLGTCYKNGRGVEKDWNLALKWYKAAIDNSDRYNSKWHEAYNEVIRKQQLLAEIIEQNTNENQFVEESEAERKKRFMSAAEIKWEEEKKEKERQLAAERERQLAAERRARQSSNYSSSSSGGYACAGCGGSGTVNLTIDGVRHNLRCRTCGGSGRVSGRVRSPFDQTLGNMFGTTSNAFPGW